jgi:glycosyltransferase involved in cell wall biosynthesis
MVKKAKITIYTRGIQDSPAWKMAEYLSQGKVIVAEKIRSELPIALEHQKHVLFFESIEEIPLLCEQVLNEEKLSKSLSENGRLYYENNISPKVNIKRIIDFMLEHPKK